MNTQQDRERVIQLIQEGTDLDPDDSTRLDSWLEKSYQALEPFLPSQQQFDKYCRSSTDHAQVRAYLGIHFLKLVLSRLGR